MSGVRIIAGLVWFALAALPAARGEDAPELFARGVRLLREDGAAALDRAIPLFEQAVAADLTFAAGHQGLADALILRQELEGKAEDRDLRQAVAHLETVLRLRPADARAYFSLAAAHFDLREDRPGMHALRKAALCAPDDSEIALAWFDKLLESGRRGMAALQAESIAERFAGNAEVFTALGDGFLRDGQAAAAAVQYETAVALQPKNASFRYALGNACKAKGDDAKAAEAYAKALELDSKLNEARLGLGYCHGRMGDFDRAIAATAAYLEAVPDDPAALNNLAILYEKAGRSEEAANTWTRLKNAPTATPVHRRRAVARLEPLPAGK